MLSSRSSRVGGKRLGVGAAEQLFQALGDVDEPGLVDHQLARQVHQVIEPVALDANRLGHLGLPGLSASSWRPAVRRS